MTSNNSDNILLDNSKTRLNDSTRLILKYWYSKCKIYYKCHKETGHYYDRLNKYMGVPAVLMGIFNTTTIFSNYNAQNQTLALVNGSACFVATILAALQNYFDLSKLANIHTKQANGYSKIINTIEKILMYEKLTNNNEISSKIIDNIMNQMEMLQHDSPNIPSRIWTKYNTELKSMISVIISSETFISDVASISSRNSTVDNLHDNSSRNLYERNINERKIDTQKIDNKQIDNKPIDNNKIDAKTPNTNIVNQELDTPEKNDDKTAIEIVYDNNPKK